MRKNLGVSILVPVVLLLISSAFPSFGQHPSMIPQGLKREPTNPDEAAYREQQIRNSIENQSRQALRDAERRAHESIQLRADKPMRMTREERRRLEQLTMADPLDVQRYSVLLGNKNTGIFKIFPDADCVTRNVVRTDGPCSGYVTSTSHKLLGNESGSPGIHLNNDQINAVGFFTQQVLVDLGEIGIESVSLNTSGMKLLTDLQPAPSVAKASAKQLEIGNGIDIDGHLYSDRMPVRVGHTYAVRSIAYRNSNSRDIYFGPRREPSKDYLGFAMIAGKERPDSIVLFHVIRKNEDKSLTIVWRQIDRKKSPKLNFEKNEPMLDFRTNPFY